MGAYDGGIWKFFKEQTVFRAALIHAGGSEEFKGGAVGND